MFYMYTGHPHRCTTTVIIQYKASKTNLASVEIIKWQYWLTNYTTKEHNPQLCYINLNIDNVSTSVSLLLSRDGCVKI